MREQDNLIPSLRRRLSVRIAVLIVFVGLSTAGYSFFEAFREARELQDHTLRQIGSLLATIPASAATSARLPAPRNDPESQIVVVSTLGSTVPMHAPFHLVGGLNPGFHTVEDHDEAWRIFVTQSADDQRVAVGQRTAVRDELAVDAALRIVLALLLLVPILLLVLHDLLKKTFLPIEAQARAVEARSEQDLTPLPTEGVFSEVHPFIAAINRLLNRVGGYVESQQRFVADAAHELRSPLTALSLQAERLAQADMSDEARARLAPLRAGIARGSALLEQMLTLARVQHRHAPSTPPARTRTVITQVIGDLLPQADARHIDLGANEVCDTWLPVPAFEFSLVLKNLIENAIRYSPEGSTIDVGACMEQDALVVSVADDGPGIPPEAAADVLQPFHRLTGDHAEGSGLGLSIVKAIVGRCGGTMSLGSTFPATGRGLRVEIRLPRPADDATSPG